MKTPSACTPTTLAAVVARYGVLRSGQHSEDSGYCCILEAVSVCDGVDWTDSPEDLDRPDIRPLNDAAWPSDEARTAAMLRLAPMLSAWPSWTEAQRKKYMSRVVLRTVRELVPPVLRAIGLDKEATACEDASTLAAAAGASWAAQAAAEAAEATEAAEVARAAAGAARASRAAALAAALAARTAAAGAAAGASWAARAAARAAWAAEAAEAAKVALAARTAARAAEAAARAAGASMLDLAISIWTEEAA